MAQIQTTLGTWLDPAVVKLTLVNWGFKVIAVVVIFVIGRWLAKLLVSWMRRTLAMDERVLKGPAPTLLDLKLNASSVDIAVRPWVQIADYWTVRSNLLERIKVTPEENGLCIPYPQQDVHLFKETPA